MTDAEQMREDCARWHEEKAIEAHAKAHAVTREAKEEEKKPWSLGVERSVRDLLKRAEHHRQVAEAHLEYARELRKLPVPNNHEEDPK